MADDIEDFFRTRILRHPTTWLFAAIGFAYGGYSNFSLRESRRAAGEPLQTASLMTDRLLDITLGGTVQVILLLIAIYVVAGLLEKTNVWLRQSVVLAIYVGSNVLIRVL
ncbi:hypothetical protein [Blastopirellula marina]|uniref:Yip1 domain-containing protein n=1 Tax=Blastopirellula marina TaxID=124 RepID=A0A2S8F250_9BACT|nr:hypothetical protein [Blastopirellula marina]PQO26248.1 hypothetical protein C5Y98_30845 [Blastopirellula marina]PQO47130.1 hypothetical protein C5Y93_03555 [Blastopirellula marina]PTL40647.1 hypothetical protein C5Y97_30860 [Blastopirellula marina]